MTQGAASGARTSDRRAAATIIGGHVVPHLYLQGFYVIVPVIYTALSLTPVTAGLLELARRSGGGLASMVGGVYVDRRPRSRIPLLPLSLVFVGVAYLVIGVAPTVPTLAIAIFVAGAAHSLWHPAAMGLLSERFPERRGFMIATHRSSGSVGDVVGPVIVGALLVVMSWQTVLIGAIPIALVAAGVVWAGMRGAHHWVPTATSHEHDRSLAEQMRALRAVIVRPGLSSLLVIAVFSGLGQGGLLMWLGLYLSEEVGMGSLGIGVHVALLTGAGIIVGPYIGSLSDRIGRRSVITVVLLLKTVFASLLAIVGAGLLFGVAVALMGGVLYGANSLIQAAALDAADGQQLEGTMLGLLWGLNALSTGISPVLIGALVAALGYGSVFWFVAAANGVATLVAVAAYRVNGVAVGP